MTKINVIDIVTDDATYSIINDMASDMAANVANDTVIFQSIGPTCYWVDFGTGLLQRGG